jgi:hypothetical protein
MKYAIGDCIGDSIATWSGDYVGCMSIYASGLKHFGLLKKKVDNFEEWEKPLKDLRAQVKAAYSLGLSINVEHIQEYIRSGKYWGNDFIESGSICPLLMIIFIPYSNFKLYVACDTWLEISHFNVNSVSDIN